MERERMWGMERKSEGRKGGDGQEVANAAGVEHRTHSNQNCLQLNRHDFCDSFTWNALNPTHHPSPRFRVFCEFSEI